jgi:hypothetical protein
MGWVVRRAWAGLAMCFDCDWRSCGVDISPGDLECRRLHGYSHLVSNSLGMSIRLVPHQPHRLQFRHSVWVLEHIHLSAPSFHYMMVT